jgi:hypothetical protein
MKLQQKIVAIFMWQIKMQQINCHKILMNAPGAENFISGAEGVWFVRGVERARLYFQHMDTWL